MLGQARTQATLPASDLERAKQRGVTFEAHDFDGFDRQTSIATFPQSRSAWFRDTEGNLFDIVQLADVA